MKKPFIDNLDSLFKQQHAMTRAYVDTFAAESGKSVTNMGACQMALAATLVVTGHSAQFAMGVARIHHN